MAPTSVGAWLKWLGISWLVGSSRGGQAMAAAATASCAGPTRTTAGLPRQGGEDFWNAAEVWAAEEGPLRVAPAQAYDLGDVDDPRILRGEPVRVAGALHVPLGAAGPVAVAILQHGVADTCQVDSAQLASAGGGGGPRQVAVAACQQWRLGTCAAPVLSHRGLDPLARRLASWGLMAVSIDLRFVQCSSAHQLATPSADIIVRGQMALRHLELLAAGSWPGLDLQLPPVDLGRVALVGHSRGALAMRAAVQMLAHSPQWPRLSGTCVRRLVELAPVDAQLPTHPDLAGPYLSAPGVPWTVVVGACDAEVGGLGLYPVERLLSRPDGWHPSVSTVFVWGANHAHFNAAWQAPRPAVGPTVGCSGGPQRALTAAQQQNWTAALVASLVVPDTLGRADVAAASILAQGRWPPRSGKPALRADTFFRPPGTPGGVLGLSLPTAGAAPDLIIPHQPSLYGATTSSLHLLVVRATPGATSPARRYFAFHPAQPMAASTVLSLRVGRRPVAGRPAPVADTRLCFRLQGVMGTRSQRICPAGAANIDGPVGTLQAVDIDAMSGPVRAERGGMPMPRAQLEAGLRRHQLVPLDTDPARWVLPGSEQASVFLRGIRLPVDDFVGLSEPIAGLWVSASGAADVELLLADVQLGD